VWEGGLLEQHAWTPHKPPHHSLAPCRPLASSASSWAASPSAASHGLWAASPSAREWGFKNRARGSHWHNGRPFLKVPSNQEAGTNATFGRHVSNHYIFGILSSRSVDWYMYGYNPRRGGGPGGGPFFGVGLQKRILATSTDFQIYRRIPELKPSRFTPFLSKLDQGGDMWTCPKVRGTRSGAGRGVSQAKEAAITLFSCLLLKPIKDNFSLRN
jgi:hypothetical protein